MTTPSDALAEAARKVLAQYEPHEITDAEAELRDALSHYDAVRAKESSCEKH